MSDPCESCQQYAGEQAIGNGPSGVSKAPASRREATKAAATASSAATADRK